MEEHKLGRTLTGRLVEAKERFVEGAAAQLTEIVTVIGQLVEFYPRHIEKEDKHFFPDTERHYTSDELEAMIQSFYTFDMRMIHEKYESVVQALAAP